MANTTSTYKKCENPMTWQITHFKRALDGVEECVKRLRSVADSCYESNKFAEENRHDSGKIFTLFERVVVSKILFQGIIR